MSMYAQILDTALGERSEIASDQSTTGALSRLRECSRRLRLSGASTLGVGRTSILLAHQVAYDISLIDLARCLDIDCDTGTFDRPEQRRKELVQEMSSRGIDVEELEEAPRAAWGRR